MGRQSFLKGAFILAFASVLIRTIGFIYQIIIIRLIGTEGIGIFNMVYPLYITALVFVTAGLPLAISKFISEEKSYNKVASENLLSVSITVLILTSTIVSLLLVLFSPYLIRAIYTDSRVIPSFLILVPTLLLCAVSSAIKSFFQGKQDMRPTAQSQLIEQIIRFLTGLILVYLLYPLGLTWAAVGLSIAILISEIGGFVYLRISFRKYSPTAKLVTTPSSKVIIKLFSFGIPVTITRLVSTFLIAAEASLIPRQLMKVGSTLSQATSFYGELTGVAFTLLMVPSTLSFALATSIVPAVSEAGSLNNKNELRQKSTEAINITLLAGVPCVLILYFWGSIISSLLFKAELGGQLLQFLALGGIFLYVAQTSTGILQGIGCVKTIFFIT
ncbi:MAG: stage V sporulation protein B, partial [Firmicutes bacterium HGW-Firmicutes-12]